ncbi:hypothetical protein GGR14_002449 [Butyricimonas faecihominis]|uniref:Uncharacterized protein n=1 Tax=Butyricimonas faecihominis TaxID=1472416 RepID=A0A7W6HX56_9BACT|nr:hypothetical protein [Butyricimonas faecihominis]MBB4026648.1 hypothetical protein [Butyricimonas faecihominis]
MPQSKRNYGQSPPLVRRVAAFGVVVAAVGVLRVHLSPHHSCSSPCPTPYI